MKLENLINSHIDLMLISAELLKITNNPQIALDSRFEKISQFSSVFSSIKPFSSSQKYDLIFSLHVFPLYFDIENLLDSYKQALEDGGVLIMGCVGGATLQELRNIIIEEEAKDDKLVMRVLPMLKIEGLAAFAEKRFKNSTIYKNIERIEYASFFQMLSDMRKAKITLPFCKPKIDSGKTKKDFILNIENLYQKKFSQKGNIYSTCEFFNLVAFK